MRINVLKHKMIDLLYRIDQHRPDNRDVKPNYEDDQNKLRYQLLKETDTEIDKRFLDCYLGKDSCPELGRKIPRFNMIRPLVEQGIAVKLEPIQILKSIIVAQDIRLHSYYEESVQKLMTINFGQKDIKIKG